MKTSVRDAPDYLLTGHFSRDGRKNYSCLHDMGFMRCDPLTKNVNALDEFGTGAGFSGVYDVDSGKFLAHPSGDTLLLNGTKPLNLVDRQGGHQVVNLALSQLLGEDDYNRLGFSMTVDSAGNLSGPLQLGDD